MGGLGTENLRKLGHEGNLENRESWANGRAFASRGKLDYDRNFGKARPWPNSDS